MSAVAVRPSIELINTYIVAGTGFGQTSAKITFTDDGPLIVMTTRTVKGSDVIDVPRRIESAHDLLEALTR